MNATAAKKEPTQPTLVGAIFDKYPEVNFISWHQYFDGPYFYVEPWSVHVNGKYVGSDNPFVPLAGDITTVKGGPVTEQEHAAMIELEDLLVLAAGGKKGAGTLDHKTETAVNLGALLRAVLGDGVIVTINRDGSIKREPSEGSENAEYEAENRAEAEAEDARAIAFKTHVLACGQCASAVHDNERRISRSYLCEKGRGLAEAVEADSGVVGSAELLREEHLWNEVRNTDREETDEEKRQAEHAFDETSAEMDKRRRQYSVVDRVAKRKKKKAGA
jgi:hypothetical protein